MKKYFLLIALIFISYNSLNAVDQYCSVNGCDVYLYEDPGVWTLTIFCDSGELSITSGTGEYVGSLCFGQVNKI